METKDRQHLQWIYERMVHMHKENEDYDYMIKFQSILKALRKADVIGSLVSPNTIQKQAEKFQQATANKMAIERTAFAQGALWVRSLFLPNDR